MWNTQLAVTRMCHALINTLCVLACALVVAGQLGEVSFKQVGVQQGLSHDSVLSILQDRHGFVWLGTVAGLNRFDGYKVTTYLSNPADEAALADDRINALYEDHYGTIWIGTTGGLHAYEPITGKFRRYLSNESQKHVSGGQYILAIIGDGAKGLWIGTNDGLQHFDIETQQFKTWHHDPKDATSLSSNLISALATDERGNLWVGTSAGLDRLSSNGKQVTHYRIDNKVRHGTQPQDNYIRSLKFARNKVLWVGTLTGLVSGIFDGESPVWQDVLTGQVADYQPVYAIDESKDGAIWIGTATVGLLRHDPLTGRIDHYRHYVDDPLSLSDNQVRTILIDRNEELWVGTWGGGGANRLSLASGGFRHIVQHLGEQNTFSSRNFSSVLGDGKGNLWIATRDAGLNKLDLKTGKVTVYKHDPKRLASLNDDRLVTMAFDNTGKLWVGGLGGLSQFDEHTGNFYLHRFNASNNAPTADIIEVIALGRDGTFWVGTHGGLHHFNPLGGQSMTYRHEPNDPLSIASDSVTSFLEDSSGTRWVSTPLGLDRMDSLGHFTHVESYSASPAINNAEVDSLFQDHAGQIWLGTVYGLARLDRGPDGEARIHALGDAVHPIRNRINMIKEDSSGQLWLGTKDGISRLDPKTGHYIEYSPNDGLLDGGYLYGGAYNDSNGTLYFSCARGLTLFQPFLIKKDPYRPQVAITDFQIFNRSVREQTSLVHSRLTGTIEYANSITLSYKDSVFSIEFSALSFADAMHNHYAYKLEGFDPDWNFTDSSKRFATYTNLDPGTYRFRVKAANKDGLWNEEGAFLDIVITPPYWRTWWFRILLLLGILAIGVAAYRARIEALTRRNAILEKHVASRTTALRQALNEQRAILNNALTGIAFLKDNIVVRCNAGFEQIFGYEPDELIGKPVQDLFLKQSVYEAFLRGEELQINHGNMPDDIELKRKDGRWIWCASHVKLVNLAAPEEGSVWVVQDTTTRREAELSSRAAREKAEVATRAKSIFLANMSHEIRTPMNAVVGLAHLALQTKLSDKQRDYLNKIQRSGQSLLALINDILDFSKIEAGKLDVEVVPFSLDEVLGNVSVMTSQKAADKRIEYLFIVAADVPRQLQGDALRLTQILVNLVNNAVKFTEPGGEIAVGVEVIEQGDRFVALRFIVRDTGIGMSEEQQRLLFQPFTQADGSTTRRYGGTGLGLSISSRLAELMGGRIIAKSALGEGSVFQFELRFELADKGLATAKFQLVPSGIRALVVDDSQVARDVICHALQQLQVQVDAVDTGRAAIDRVRAADATSPYQIVVTDWQMEPMDGIAVINTIKTDASLLHKPKVILMTAFGLDEVEQMAEDAGVDGVLFKPINISAVHDALARVLSHSVVAPSLEYGAETPHFSDVRVLLAEDNEINQQIATELLEMVGVEVDVAIDGAQVVDMALSAPVDRYALILMDLEMPHMDGHAATLAIRKHAQLDHVPIVALTAHAIGDVRVQCLEEGMQDYLTKPIQPERLYKLVSRWVNSAVKQGDKQEQVETSAEQPKASASVSSEPFEHIDLATFTLFDTAQGLRLMAGKRRLYFKLLERFRAGEGGTVARIRTALANNDLETAERLVHTLKGLAGNLGAQKVQDAAARLEAAFAQASPANAQVINDYIEALNAELKPVLDELNSVLG